MRSLTEVHIPHSHSDGIDPEIVRPSQDNPAWSKQPPIAPAASETSPSPFGVSSRRAEWPHRNGFVRRVGFYVSTVVLIAIAASFANKLWLQSINLWILVTAPFNTAHEINTVIGYSWLLDGNPIHKENLSPLFQALSFNGILSYPDGYFLRPIYPFLVSLGAWAVGLRSAALVINTLSLGVLVVTTGWLAHQLYRNRAAAISAAALAAVGTGSIVHLNDMSAHMLAFASYAVVTCILFASNVWRARQALPVHVGLAIALGIASLVYPSGLLLIIGYFLTAIAHSRFSHVLVASTVGLLSRPAWEHFLNLSYRVFFGVGPFDLYTLDFGAAKQISIDYWLDQSWNHPSDAALALMRPLVESLFVTCPALTLFGIIALLILNSKELERLFFFTVFLTLPVASVVFFSPGALARGYLVYSSAFILFASVAPLLFRTLNAIAASAAAAGCVVVQAVWSTAAYFGYLFPALAFYVGPWISGGTFTRPDVVNLAGTAPTWRFYGGSGNFIAAGGLPLGATTAGNGAAGAFGFSFLLNAFISGLILAGIAAGLSLISRRDRPNQSITRYSASEFRTGSRLIALWLVLWLVLVCSISGMGFFFQKQRLQPFSPERVTDFPGERTLEMALRVSPDASGRILDLLRTNPDLEATLYLRGSGVIDANLALGEKYIAMTKIPGPSSPLIWRLDRVAFERALAAGEHQLTFKISLRDGFVGGWQAMSSGRAVSPLLTHDDVGYWPSLEIRLMDRPRNAAVFIGY